MNLGDIAMLIISATMANHLGLVDAVERVARHRLPVINCSKCLAFWSVLLCAILSGARAIPAVAVAFASAYTAVWLELLLGSIDTLYNKIYESLYPEETDTTTDTED